MNILLWILFGYFVLSIILQPAAIGRPRKPKTEGEAITGSVILAVLALLLIIGGHWS